MSTAFEAHTRVVRDQTTGAVIAGAVVSVFVDNGSGGRGPLASQVYTLAGALIDQVTQPLTTGSNGAVTFRLAPGVYFLEAEWGANLFQIPGYTSGMASARDVGAGAGQLPLPGQIPAALLGRPAEPSDAGSFFAFNAGGSYVLTTLWGVTPASGRVAGRVLQVNPAANGVGWVDLPAGVLPALTGNAGRVLVVNEEEDAAEWTPPPQVVYPDFAGHGGWVLRVTPDQSAVEWWNPNPPYTISTIATAGNRVVAAGDHNTILEALDPGGVNFLLALNSVQAVPVGTLVTITRASSGDCSITAAIGVLLNGFNGLSVAIPEQWGAVTLYKRAPDEWVISGQYEAP